MRRLLLACLFLMALITHASNYNIRDYGAKGDVVIDTNRNGIDIDCCKYVTVSNCKVNTPNDDAIVLKSLTISSHPRKSPPMMSFCGTTPMCCSDEDAGDGHAVLGN